MLTFTPQWPVFANDLEGKSIGKRLENALNKEELVPLMDLFPQQEGFDLASRYKVFLKAFPNAKWTINEAKPLKDGRQSLEIIIAAQRRLQNTQYSIKARQVLGIKTLGGKIVDQELMSEQTIIQDSEYPLQISLNIPEAVLTGTSYDFDIILEKPLGDAIIAGGLTDISSNQIRNQVSPNIELKPLGAGGLFKSVQAPINAGIQNWAAMLAHPKGLISITKMVRIVPNQSDLEL